MGFARVLNLPRSIPAAMPKPTSLEHLLVRAEAVLARLEAVLPLAPALPDWGSAVAFRWRKNNGRGWLQAVRQPHPIRLSDLENIDDQKARIYANTRQFVTGHTANNVLLTGSRGSGKSSLVKAVLNEFSGKGLRLIEVDKDDLVDLADIVDLLDGRPERFIIFCDDLSFEAGETAYKALKSVLDGSVAAPPDNKRSDRLPRCDERIRRCTFGRARNSPRPRQTRQYYSNSRQCRWRDSAAAEGASGSGFICRALA